jgi:TfoX/Sxy family transcriptional regulator of competence genes
MSFDLKLADRVRNYLSEITGIKIEEKKMFSGLAFMVNDKMCVNVSGENLMCRFDPDKQQEIEKKMGYLPMLMRGKELKGYCYVSPKGIQKGKDFEFWIELCLEFNSKAKSSKKKTK